MVAVRELCKGKSVFLAMLVSNGLKRNEYAINCVNAVVTLSDLIDGG